MSEMKTTPSFLALFLAVLLCVLRCVKPVVVETGGGTQTFGLRGTVVDTAGQALAGADIALYELVDDSIVDTLTQTPVLTDTSGTFFLPYDSLLLGRTVAVAADYNGGELVGWIPDIILDTSVATTRLRINDSTTLLLTFLGVDTLYAPGGIAGFVVVDRVDRSGVLAYIPGTSFNAYSDSVGGFLLSGLAPATYEVRFRETGYITERVGSVVVRSDRVVVLDTVVLRRDPAGAPPPPMQVGAGYDTMTAVVTIQWDPVVISDLKGYFVYADTGAAEPVRISELLVDTVFRDTVRFGIGDTATRVRSYQVRSVDSTNNVSDFSSAVPVICVHPSRVQTQIRWLSSPTESDTVVPGDTVALAVFCSNAGRRNTSLRWYGVDNSGLTLLAVRDGLSAQAFFDTLHYVWADSSGKLFVVEVEDESGSLWRDSIEVSPTLQQQRPNSWAVVASMPTARRHPACAELGGRLYVIGGCRDLEMGAGVTHTDRVEVLERSGASWVEAGSLLRGRWDHTVAVALGKLYVFGGLFRSVAPVPVSSVEEYDSLLGTWDSVATMPRPLAGSAAETYRDSIFLFGGYGHRESGAYIDDTIRVFDPASRTWSSRGRMMLHRHLHRVVMVDGVFFILGGRGGVSASDFDARALDRVEWFNPSTGEQGFVADMPSPRMYFGAEVVEGRILVIGGVADLSGWVSGAVKGGVEEFDPSSGSWRSKRDMNEPRYGFGTAVVDGWVYVAGGAFEMSGWTPGRTESVWKYYP